MTPPAKDEVQRRSVGYVLRRFPVLSETFILNEILALEARGLDVHVFALAPTRDPRFHEGLSRLKAHVTYVPSLLELPDVLRHNRRLCRRHRKRYASQLGRVLLTLNVVLLWRFLQAGYVADKARSLKVRHLHAHFANTSTTVAALAARMLRVPYSFTAHAFDIFIEGSQRHLVRRMTDAAFVVTVSKFNVAYLQDVLAGAKARIELVYNGIDLARFRPAASPPEPPPPLRILAVARLVEKKGLLLLVDACGLLRDRGVPFECAIVGKGQQRPALDARIRELGLPGGVKLLGARTQGEVLELYRWSHVLALPCLVGDDGNRDGLPVSIVEALACGVPVISTAVTGIPEAVQHGENGLLVRERDPAALADALASLAGDAELRSRLARAARPSVTARFDQDATADRIFELFSGGGS